MHTHLAPPPPPLCIWLVINIFFAHISFTTYMCENGSLNRSVYDTKVCKPCALELHSKLRVMEVLLDPVLYMYVSSHFRPGTRPDDYHLASLTNVC